MFRQIATSCRFPILVSAITILAIAGGCEKESGVGGPGAPATGSGSVTSDNPAGNSANTFVLTVPSGQVDITQGESETISIGIERGSDFKQSVEVTITSTAKGLTVTPSTVTISSDETEVEVTLMAAADAQVGVTSLSASGKPQTGKSVSSSIEVEVNQKD